MHEDDQLKQNKHNAEAAIERRMKVYQKQRELRRRKIMLSRLRKFLRFILIILLIWGIYRLYNCKMWYLNSAVFNTVENNALKITGNNIIRSLVIRNADRKCSSSFPLFTISKAYIHITKTKSNVHIIIELKQTE